MHESDDSPDLHGPAADERGERAAGARLLRMLLLPQQGILVSACRLLLFLAAAAVFLLDGRLASGLGGLLLALALALFLFARSLTPLLARDWSPFALAATLATNGASELFGEVSWQQRQVQQVFFAGGSELPGGALVTSVPQRRAGEVIGEMLDQGQQEQLRAEGIVHVRDLRTPFGSLQLRLVDRDGTGLRIRAVLETSV